MMNEMFHTKKDVQDIIHTIVFIQQSLVGNTPASAHVAVTTAATDRKHWTEISPSVPEMMILLHIIQLNEVKDYYVAFALHRPHQHIGFIMAQLPLLVLFGVRVIECLVITLPIPNLRAISRCLIQSELTGITCGLLKRDRGIALM